MQMRAMVESRWMGALGAAIVCIPLLLSARAQLGSPMDAAVLSGAARRMAPLAPRDEFERAYREAVLWHIRAWQVVNEHRYAVEAWDNAAAEQMDQAAWRGELLARDSGGYLRRVRRIARQAAALARTDAERYQAALLRAVLASEAGDPQEEWQQVCVLARLAPHSWVTRLWLRHGAGHRALPSIPASSRRALLLSAPRHFFVTIGG